jgi:Ca2+-binding EF-hand superfamily protein
MKHKRFQMLFVLMSVFFFATAIFMTPKIAEGKQAEFINKYDKDEDGKISKDEFKGSDKAFDNLDKNQDGYIDKDEAQKDRKKQSKKGEKGYINKYDKDGDGKLSKDEFPGSDKAFSNLDKNQDGYIDKSEAQKDRNEREDGSKKKKKGKHDKKNKDKGDDDKDE